MNIHYFQHVPFEGLGSIENWARKPDHKVTATRFYEDHKLPFIDICDMLIIMGGPMGVYDEDKYEWMAEEKRFIEKAIVRGKKVIGICLGAQLIAEVLGSKVYKNKEKEIGWMPLKLTPEGKKANVFSDFTDGQNVFHWHGDTFDLPNGAIQLASSEACEQQAFLYDNQVLGLQFHLETTEDSVAAMLENCKSDLEQGGKYVQTRAEISNDDHIYRCNRLIEKIITKL
ncbi:MAG TPA: type 1 glutamine amidotransferase [Cytophagaceae bacterium]|jgi:GMP synthase-like glutamine amidotransferase|nr:type 1 glutamine amidotransferase [Cytophagaceae bacterium]